MSYQSFNPSTGKLLQRFEELTDSELDAHVSKLLQHSSPLALPIPPIQRVTTMTKDSTWPWQ